MTLSINRPIIIWMYIENGGKISSAGKLLEIGSRRAFLQRLTVGLSAIAVTASQADLLGSKIRVAEQVDIEQPPILIGEKRRAIQDVRRVLRMVKPRSPILKDTLAGAEAILAEDEANEESRKKSADELQTKADESPTPILGIKRAILRSKAFGIGSVMLGAAGVRKVVTSLL